MSHIPSKFYLIATAPLKMLVRHFDGASCFYTIIKTFITL